jgi:SOS-response transcriptional repressor LexA
LAELKRRGVRNVELARLLEITEDKVSKVFAGKRRLQIEEVLTLNRFLAGGELPPSKSPAPPAAELADPGRGFAMPPMQSLAKDVPVLGSCLAAPLHLPQVPEDIEQIEMGLVDVVEYVRRPPAMVGNRGLYALYVQTNSMEPRHHAGALIFVDPRRPPAVGDDVIVQLRDGNGHDGDERVVCALLKTLVRRTLAGLELRQYNPPLEFFVPAERIKAVHRVPELAELMGF